MSLRHTLAELSSAVKGKLGVEPSDPDLHAAERELEDALANAPHHASSSSSSSSSSALAMDERTARTILGLADHATLDEVRSAAATLGRQALAGRIDDANGRAIDRIATAAEYLEERLLPLSGQTEVKPQAPTLTTTTTRTRATPRR
jgi:hypothetical protein